MNREIVVTMGGRNYTVKYPNVGQFIDIASKENVLSRGTLKDMAFSDLSYQGDAYVYVKIIAFVEVMMPELVRDLKVNSLLELDPVDFQELTNMYFDKILKWLNEWKERMQKPTE